MRSFLIVLALTISFTIEAQEFSTLPQSIDLVEAGDEISIFKGELIFGKSHVYLYFSGLGVNEVKLYLDNGESLGHFNDIGRLNIDYLENPVWFFRYGEREFKAETELIQTDWPGNEINWRMVPRVHFTEIVH